MTKRTLLRLAVMSSLICVPFVLGGTCRSTTVRGGGFVPSACDASKKATFGFQIDCDVETQEVSGDLRYVDHGCDVKLKAAANWLMDPATGSCVEGGTLGSYCGTYWVNPDEPSELGTACVDFVDEAVSISVSGGPYDLYENAGFLDGGSLNFAKN